MIKISW